VWIFKKGQILVINFSAHIYYYNKSTICQYQAAASKSEWCSLVLRKLGDCALEWTALLRGGPC